MTPRRSPTLQDAKLALLALAILAGLALQKGEAGRLAHDCAPDCAAETVEHS